MLKVAQMQGDLIVLLLPPRLSLYSPQGGIVDRFCVGVVKNLRADVSEQEEAG